MSIDRDLQSAASARHAETRIDGARVRYLEAGQGEPVLLLHGYPQSHLCWRHQIPALARTHRVIAPDWFGYGRSEPGEAPPTYDTEVERIGQLADRLGLARFNLIGHDYGGFLGLGFVLRQPQRVLRLGLLNSRAHGTFRPWFYRFSLLQAALVRSPLARALPISRLHRRALRRYRSLGCFTPEIEHEYLGWMDSPDRRDYFFRFFTHYHLPVRPELAPALAQIQCPTAIVWGQRDPYIASSIARELAARIPNATLSILPDADHFVMEERPDEVLANLRQLLSRTL